MAATAMIAGTIGIAALSAKGQREEGMYQKAVMDQNARIAEQQADDAIKRGRVEEAQHRLKIRELIGAQRASMAAQGIEINNVDDSAGALQLSSRAQGEYDALIIRNNAAREAWGYKVQASDYKAQGKLIDKASRNAARDTILGSIVKAGSMAAGSYGGGPKTTPTTSSAARVPMTGGNFTTPRYS